MKGKMGKAPSLFANLLLKAWMEKSTNPLNRRSQISFNSFNGTRYILRSALPNLF